MPATDCRQNVTTAHVATTRARDRRAAREPGAKAGGRIKGDANLYFPNERRFRDRPTAGGPSTLRSDCSIRRRQACNGSRHLYFRSPLFLLVAFIFYAYFRAL